MKLITIDKRTDGVMRVRLWHSEASYQELLYEQARNVVTLVREQLNHLEGRETPEMPT